MKRYISQNPSTYPWLNRKSQPSITDVDKQQICDWLKIAPIPLSWWLVHKVLLSLPSALISLVNCISSMCLSGIQDFKATEQSAPAVYVSKPSEEIRICVDYVHLNSVTKKDSYPIPHAKDPQQNLAGENFS